MSQPLPMPRSINCSAPRAPTTAISTSRVSTEQLHAIWDLMKMAPTSANQLPARLVWCTSDEAKEKLAACTMPANGAKIRKAPVIRDRRDGYAVS
jgi:nitroreductase